MDWIYYYLLPLAVAWKKRSGELGPELFSLYNVMFSSFLAFWCEGFVTQSLSALIPKEYAKFMPWLSCCAVILIWIIALVAFNKCLEKLAPSGLDSFIYHAKTSKIAVPVIVFFKTGLICAVIFSAFSITPAAQYVPFITQNESLCSGARFRVLFNSFLIDRFSLQSTSLTQRRRAFDRFVPEQVAKENTKSSDNKKEK